MRIHQFRYSNERQPANNTHVKFATEENATCSPDPYMVEWFIEEDDLTQLACVFGVTQLFEAVEDYYNGNVDKEIWAAVLIHDCLNRFSEAKVSISACSDSWAKDLYVLNKQIEKDAFIVHALHSFMHTVLDEKLNFCLVALIFMNLLRSKEVK